MQDALPDLFEAAPDLMYSLVTMVSPMNLQVITCVAKNQICFLSKSSAPGLASLLCYMPWLVTVGR